MSDDAAIADAKRLNGVQGDLVDEAKRRIDARLRAPRGHVVVTMDVRGTTEIRKLGPDQAVPDKQRIIGLGAGETVFIRLAPPVG